MADEFEERGWEVKWNLQDTFLVEESWRSAGPFNEAAVRTEMEADPCSNVRTTYVRTPDIKSCQSSHITSVSRGRGGELGSSALKSIGLGTEHRPHFILQLTGIGKSPWCDGASIYRKVEIWENGPRTTEGHDHWPGKGRGAWTLAHILSGPLTSSASPVRNAERWAPPRPTESEQAYRQDPQVLSHTVKSVNCLFR